jgi:hypothetical protein
MDNRQKMEVIDWQDSFPQVISKNRVSRRFLSRTLVGIFGTLLLHTLFIQSLLFVAPSHKIGPPEARADAIAKSKDDSAETLVLIDISTTENSVQASSQNITSSLPDLRKLKVNPRFDVDKPELLNIEALSLSEEKPFKSGAGSRDSAELARFIGIHTGQIQARIARVWRRPRTPVNEEKSSIDDRESFQCEAQIVQDASGNVQEVMLRRCNGSAAWRNSLVLAIQHASPLPAPPSERVFSASITLNFVGLNYFAGAPDDDYEPTRRPLLSAK